LEAAKGGGGSNCHSLLLAAGGKGIYDCAFEMPKLNPQNKITIKNYVFPFKSWERKTKCAQKLFYFSLSFYFGSGNDIQIVSNLFTILPKNTKKKR